MDIDALISQAVARGATDVHLEPGLPAAWRVDGDLATTGAPLEARDVERVARRFLDASRRAARDDADVFEERGSADLSATIAGVRCRLAVMRTSRGVGVAIRVLHDVQPTLSSLNLHPDLARLVDDTHGLVLLTGPTGSGKSSTLAALVHEVNVRRPAHVLTIEQPIEYAYRSRRAFIRQREVERDTPSWDQALRDALREDPDVLVVGEMRRPSTMRLVLAAAETGHLVLATMHASSVAEALQRIVTGQPAEMQDAVRAQLADVLRSAVGQRLVYRPELGLRLPELEVLRATTAARSLVRQGQFFKLQLVLDTGRKDGCWSRERYREWLETKHDWHVREARAAPGPEARDLTPVDADEALEELELLDEDDTPPPAPRRVSDDDVIVVDPPSESLSDLLSELRDDDEDDDASPRRPRR